MNLVMARRIFAVFVGIHGIIHLLGVLPAWRLPAPDGMVHTTTVLFGHVEIGETGAQLLGIAWVVVGALLVATAVRVWLGRPGAAVAVIGAAAASAVLCVLYLDVAEAGLTVDACLISVLLVAPVLAGGRRDILPAFLR
ncbi:MAG: hypothetical protein U0838_11530 [Chloroflexota bacterium]